MTSIHQVAVPIIAKDGTEYLMSPLHREVAVSESVSILTLHSLIPHVERWTSVDLSSNAYPNRWSVSAVVREAHSDKVVAFLIAYLRRSSDQHPLDAIYLHRLAVHPQYQRRGIGTAFLKNFLSNCFRSLPWLQQVTVQTNDFAENNGVIDFYERLGFLKQFQVHYLNKVDWLFLLKRRDAKLALRWQPINMEEEPQIRHPHVNTTPGSGPHVYISTTNARKFSELEYLFSSFNVSTTRVDPPIGLTEPQIDGAEHDLELVQHPLRSAARFLEKKNTLPFVVEDTMLFIEFFNKDFNSLELPGYDTKRWWRQLGNEGVLSIMKGSPLRRARYVSQIGGYFGKGRYNVARGEVEGYISNEVKQSPTALAGVPMTSPWFFHSIFIPNGSKLTFAEMGPIEFAKYDYKRRAVSKFVAHLEPDTQLSLPLELPNGD